jgi:hypothetical protein
VKFIFEVKEWKFASLYWLLSPIGKLFWAKKKKNLDHRATDTVSLNTTQNWAWLDMKLHFQSYVLRSITNTPDHTAKKVTLNHVKSCFNALLSHVTCYARDIETVQGFLRSAHCVGRY